MIEVFMTADEVAQKLRVSTDHVYKLARENKIPYNAIGTRKVFSPSALQAWLLSNQKGVGNGRKTAK